MYAGAIALTAAINLSALSVVNVMGNRIGKEELSRLQEIMRSKPTLVSLCGIADDATEADLSALSGLGMDADDVSVLVLELPSKRTLSTLRMPGNDLCDTAAGQAMGDMLSVNTVLRKLDMSNCNMQNPDSSKAFAGGLSSNVVLLDLNISKNNLGRIFTNGHGDGDKRDDRNWGSDLSGEQSPCCFIFVVPSPITHRCHTSCAVVPVSGMYAGAIALTAAIRLSALSVVNVMGNRIGKEELSRLQGIMRSKPTLVSLCGIADDATEADLSGLGMDADDVSVLVLELPSKENLAKLSLKNNKLATARAGEALGKALKGNMVLKEFDISSNSWNDELTVNKVDGAGFAQGLSKGLSGDGMMSALNISKNMIKGAKAGEGLGDALAANSVLKKLNLSGEKGSPNMDIDFMTAFAPRLAQNSSLSVLDLSSNGLTNGRPWPNGTGHYADMAGNLYSIYR
jgi:uncharacterized membrane protein